MIETSRKDKLDKERTYPVGAKVIDQALTVVPQYDSIKLEFRERPTGTFKSEYALLEKNKDPRPTLRAYFYKLDYAYALNDKVRQNSINGVWGLNVFSILKTDKEFVKTMVLELALPEVVKWLSTSRNEGWFFGKKVFMAIVDYKEEKLLFLEDEGSEDYRGKYI